MFKTNPYIAGNPVGDSQDFIGRQDVLREVIRTMRRPQDNVIVLFGQRRIGKTSILQHLASRLPQENAYIPVYYDLQDKASWPLERVLKNLSRTIAFAIHEPDPDLGENPEQTFRDAWLLEILENLEGEHSLALLFDEFDVLADPKAEQAAATLFPYLRELIATDPARLQFVFVIGRKMDDLSTIALSLFKGAPSMRVSLLDRSDTETLIRLSEANDSLHWSDAAVEAVWVLTHGHPFLTQQLCSRVWEQAYDEEPGEIPTVTPEKVTAAVPEALEASRNTMEWIWEGLPPAERVVISTLAESGPDPISQSDLERLLYESGVRVVIRELQNAPQLLQDWDLIEPTTGGYRFRVELLRRWILNHKPLSRVQDELDRLEPVAENLYQAATGLYRSGQLDASVDLLRRALGLNPNHVKASQLLAEILLSGGEVDEAIELLERLYTYQPAAARSRLVQALLTQAEKITVDEELVEIYEHVLELDSAQPEARAKLDRLRKEARQRELEEGLAELADHESARRYDQALELERRLAQAFPAERDWEPDLQRLEKLAHISELYQRALGAMQSQDHQVAKSLLSEIVYLDPDYQDAARYLAEVVAGVGLKATKKPEEIDRREEHRSILLPLKTRMAATRERRRAARSALLGEGATSEAKKLNHPSQLSSGNPLDYARLLFWMVARPTQLLNYWHSYGESRTQRMGVWMASIILWFVPFLFPWLASVLGLYPDVLNLFRQGSNGDAVFQVGLLLFIGCLFTGWLGERKKFLGVMYALPLMVAFLLFWIYLLNEVSIGFIAGFGIPIIIEVLTVLSFSSFLDYESATDTLLWMLATWLLGSVPFTLDVFLANNWGFPFGLLACILLASGSIAIGWIALGAAARLQRGLELNGSSRVGGVLVISLILTLVFSSWFSLYGWVPFYTHQVGIYTTVHSQDGNYSAAGSGDNLVFLSKAGVLQHVLVGNRSDPFSLAFSPDGSRLASGSDDGTVYLWDTQTGARLMTQSTQGEPVETLAFSPDGKELAANYSGEDVILWSLPGGSELARLDGFSYTPLELAFSPDGGSLAANNGYQAIEWALSSKKMLMNLGDINNLDYAPTNRGDLLASGHDDGSIYVWDPRREEALLTVKQDYPVSGLALMPQGTRLASGDNDRLNVWDLDSGQQLTSWDAGAGILSLAYSPGGDQLAAGLHDGTAVIWNAANGDVVARIEDCLPGSAGQGNGSGSATLNPIKDLPVAFSPDGNFLATGCPDGRVLLWNLTSNQLVSALKGQHQDPVVSLAFAPHTSTLASGDQNGVVTLWDLTEPGYKLDFSPKASYAASGLAFSPDGLSLAVGYDGTYKDIIFWDPTSGTEQHRFKKRERLFNTVSTKVAFSPDGSSLAYLDDNLTIRLVDPNSGEVQHTLPPFMKYFDSQP